MRFLESIINMKLNSIRKDELLQLARQYQVQLTPNEAEKICQTLRGKNYNLFHPEQRRYVVSQIAGIVGNERAAQIEQIFLSFTGR
ncbi:MULTISPECIES: DUF2624 family protein [Bacillus]|uniref:DUF2624 family protein n=1 Tax=Bacillus TaxID=1386 RepID=UPI000316B2FC|nr:MULTISPECIES: DUF2624 family protein [Bacillus]